MGKTCRHCQRIFLPHPALFNQQYCGNSECQKKRKSEWQKGKLAKDRAYRDNQAAAQKRWRAKNPDYSQEYRERSPDYTERNRCLQVERNRQRRSRDVIANMDELKAGYILPSGTYRITSMSGKKIVNMDELFLQISSNAKECTTSIPVGP